jgi:hypothetical protein
VRYFQVAKPFTRRIGVNMVVGHPGHRDIRGRYFEADDGDPVAVELEGRGFAKSISKTAYRKALDEGEVADAGETRQAQLRGDYPRASITWSDARLQREARRRGVNVSKAKNRGEIVKLLNDGDLEGGLKAAEEPRNPLAETAGDTNDTTNHPANSSPQNDVGANGSIQTDLVRSGSGMVTEGEDVEVAAEEQAPTGGEGGGGSGE